MRKRACRWDLLLVVGGMMTTLTVSRANAAPPNPEFVAAKQSFLKEMKKPSAANRAAAVTALAGVMQTGSAELLLKRGFADEDANVRAAARTGLRQLADDPAVNQFLYDELKKSLRKTVVNDLTVEVLRVLAVTEDEDRQAEVVKSLDDYLASPKGNFLFPITIIDDFANERGDDAVRGCTLLARAKSFESNFGYRRSIVQAMSQIQEREAVDFLIELLPNTTGLVQYDIIQYLTRLTQQKFRDNDRSWAKWWKENRDEFEFGELDPESSEELIDNNQPSYYRIPICAKRVVFILDTSGSMRGEPIASAKQALLKTVESLPEAVNFDIVMFDTAATTWQPRLVPATAEAKRGAAHTIMERGLGPATVSSAALSAAFALEPEAIYFLSDGEPTDGSPTQIVNAVSQLNRTRRISIHAIGVVTTVNGGAGLTQFMKPLASQNYGTFRLIE